MLVPSLIYRLMFRTSPLGAATKRRRPAKSTGVWSSRLARATVILNMREQMENM